ncbi:unnamed protein product [Rhizophagus irregularis]|nr:unnamed protein product [Rhizophagus irregularis]
MSEFSKLQILKAYALDWVLCFIFLGIFFSVDQLEPYHRLFSLEDKTIQFPFAEKERVPMWLCAIIVFLIRTFLNIFRWNGFLSLYLAGKLHVFDQKGYTYKGFVVAAPLVVAILIAISRTEDYRHHWHDVFAGSLVGFLLSYFAYHQYYPDLHSKISDKPFTIRLKKVVPEYKAEFSFMDGSEVEITVVKNDEQLLLKDSRALLADSSSTNTEGGSADIVVS